MVPAHQGVPERVGVARARPDQYLAPAEGPGAYGHRLDGSGIGRGCGATHRGEAAQALAIACQARVGGGHAQALLERLGYGPEGATGDDGHGV